MSAITRNSQTLFMPTAGIVCGQLVQGSTGLTLSVANQSGDSLQQADVTYTETGTGDFLLAVTNFKGPAGKYNVSVSVNTTATTADIRAQVGAVSYSGRTLSVQLMTVIGGVAADCGLFFEIKAY